MTLGQASRGPVTGTLPEPATAPTGEDHRTTTFELFFDLVYVFAATQVTGYTPSAGRARARKPVGVVPVNWRNSRTRWAWSA